MTDYIYGKNSIEETISNSPHRINKILISENNKFDKKINYMINFCKENKIKFQFVPKEKIDKVAPGAAHQGVVAFISPIKYTSLDEFLVSLKKTNALVVMLDSIEDVHNLGAIIRTSVCAGVDGIIIPDKRSVSVTSAVEKISAGAVNKIPIIRVSNLCNSILKLKKKGFWVVGAEADCDKYYFDIDYNMNCVIVLGGENQGISNIVRKNCDYMVKIPIIGEFNSLNVSNAASVIIYEALRQRLLN